MEAKLATETGVSHPNRRWQELGLAYLEVYILPYLLKARTEEPEKQSLLANGSKTIFISRQQLGKHVPAATDTHTAIKILLEVFAGQHWVRGFESHSRRGCLIFVYSVFLRRADSSSKESYRFFNMRN
jgi:hypothetical protein